MQKFINNEQEYKYFLMRIYTLMQTDTKPDSDESNELENLSILRIGNDSCVKQPYAL
ncbi:hypothetical protein HZQ28_17955 [Elizabethkingia anophelis]|uniref:hypothetical protein n=1 Tax=Elizabethkingia meningoseptica TaxID=238 RepID=UPI0016252C29|nr:hypothetical protein [Elizabethkingia meningoseptica]MCT3649860.1 hypothetical protein [Elizabethkingia anophelis]MCT3697072.1 hypothetical protein [Elizabethkingia anophelis]MCT3861027.1 hypothetical protein [Elizabethkingia anophelis]MCT3946816.1 hypothetical protein [Elizabethkingia anophelis]MCT3996372.1 hypothetical protein [Elizabethkingia anophelis]